MMTLSNERVLFDFKQPAIENTWISINDTVMGGISQSRFIMGESDCAIFTGTVSLENNGGFASVRSPVVEYDLSDFEGILLHVFGDGKTYKLCIKTDAQFDGVLYQYRFTPKRDIWEILYLSFEDFVPTYRGRIVERQSPLNTQSIRTFGLMISEKQVGDFQLKVEWIKSSRAGNEKQSHG